MDSEFATVAEFSGEKNLVLDSLLKMFASHQTQVGIYTLPFEFDSHDGRSGLMQPVKFYAASQAIELAISKLKSVPYGEGSLYDQTTIICTSEFSRTTQQDSESLYSSGTDHNTVCNTVIGAGRAFRKLRGRILGSSDFQNPDEALGAGHWKFEDRKTKPLKFVGLPFDFNGLRTAATSMPEMYRVNDYLNYQSILHSVMISQFEVTDLPLFADGSRPPLIDAIVKS